MCIRDSPRALWWFRWAAFLTFLTGLALLHYISAKITLEIILGAVMGTLMMLNVWGIIWPNQKIVIGLKEGDAAVAGPKAALASRTNTLLSVGMLYFMVASAHYPASGQVLGANLEMTGLLVGLAIIFAIEANAIWGKMLPAITSVRSVIISSFVALSLSPMLASKFLRQNMNKSKIVIKFEKFLKFNSF